MLLYFCFDPGITQVPVADAGDIAATLPVRSHRAQTLPARPKARPAARPPPIRPTMRGTVRPGAKKQPGMMVSPLSPNPAGAVDWMPDKDVHTCTRCLIIQFSLTVRKHHCRFCGFVVCNHCSKHKLYSQATGANERCCDPCMAKAELRPVSDEYRPSFMLPEVPARRSFSVEALEMTKNETVYLARVEHDNTVVSALPSQPRLIHPTIMPSDHPAGRPCSYLRPTNACHANLQAPVVSCRFLSFLWGGFHFISSIAV